ncbi:hypothetical protein DUNSADRAFT_7696 [Dunaliella salina]|uniref:Autophagy protein ATG5 UblB domain-containing protein n=1 Tax=Dunaliella salina TaxID=3046 RepID=A0ABQ7GKW3_DUNSA|nr:hypothetical protein DUNSADRAFT_7696 [Dunaliella salina]|eukprot:KAF5835249.1 hypothetical protein DUNSADRAFT_7696 [Dunaliella salina]
MSVQEQQRHRQQQQDVQVQQQQEQGHGEAEQGSRKAGERRPHEDSAVGREEAEGPQLLGAEQVSSKAGGCQPQKDSVTGREGAEGHHSPGAETLRGMGGSDGRQRNQGAETKAGDGLRRREKVDDGAGDGHASKLGREAESAVLEAAGEEQTSSIRQGEGGGHGDCGGEGAEGQQEGSAGLAGTETTQAEQSNNLRLQVEKRYQLGSNGEAGEGEGRASVVKHLPEGQGPGQPHLEQAQQPHQDAAQLPNEPFAWTPQSYQPQQQQQQQQQQQCAQAQSAVQQQHFAPRSSLQLLPMVRVDADGRRVGGNGRDVGLDFREGRQKLRALVSGIQPPFDAPIAWLHANMHAPDYFLYVVVL